MAAFTLLAIPLLLQVEEISAYLSVRWLEGTLYADGFRHMARAAAQKLPEPDLLALPLAVGAGFVIGPRWTLAGAVALTGVACVVGHVAPGAPTGWWTAARPAGVDAGRRVIAAALALLVGPPVLVAWSHATQLLLHHHYKPWFHNPLLYLPFALLPLLVVFALVVLLALQLLEWTVSGFAVAAAGLVVAAVSLLPLIFMPVGGPEEVVVLATWLGFVATLVMFAGTWDVAVGDLPWRLSMPFAAMWALLVALWRLVTAYAPPAHPVAAGLIAAVACVGAAVVFALAAWAVERLVYAPVSTRSAEEPAW